MSGGVNISESSYWEIAGWCFAMFTDAMIDILIETEKSPSLLEYLRDPYGVPQIVSYIDLTSWPIEEGRVFREVAAMALTRLRDRDPNAQSFLDHCQKLVSELEGTY